MIAYRYRAAARSGRQMRGRAEVTDLVELGRHLHTQGLVLINAKIEESSGPGLRTNLRHSPRVLLNITRGLASLLGAGVPLSGALLTIAEVAPANMRTTLHDLRKEVEQGRGLSDALAQRSNVFPASFIGVVRAGERSGNLPDCFEQLTQHLEREATFHARIVSAVTYPAVLLVAGGAVLLLMFVFVLPRFVELVTEAGAELPVTTRLLISGIEFFKHNWGFALIATVLVFTIPFSLHTSKRGRRLIATLLVAAPVVGPIRRKFIAARFARLLCTLLRGGATVYAALGQTSDSLNDPLAQAATEGIRSEVRRGLSFSSALAGCALFPPVLSRLTLIGEESGRLPEFLEKAAELFERETQDAMERLVTLLEPVMIVMFGGAVGFIALSLLQAVYSLNGNAL